MEDFLNDMNTKQFLDKFPYWKKNFKREDWYFYPDDLRKFKKELLEAKKIAPKCKEWIEKIGLMNFITDKVLFKGDLLRWAQEMKNKVVTQKI